MKGDITIFDGGFMIEDEPQNATIGVSPEAAGSKREETNMMAIATCGNDGIYGELVTRDIFSCLQFESK